MRITALKAHLASALVLLSFSVGTCAEEDGVQEGLSHIKSSDGEDTLSHIMEVGDKKAVPTDETFRSTHHHSPLFTHVTTTSKSPSLLCSV